jgi:nickel-dependent lactate racemase
MAEFTLRWGAWYGDEDRRFALPEGYTVEVCATRGGSPLSAEEIRDGLRTAVDSPPLREMARGRRDAVVAVEDITRPAPLAELLPPILEEIHAGGVPPERTRIIIGSGGHSPMDRDALVRKLGEPVLKRYDVANHHPYENLVDLGTSERGLPIHVNRQVAEADLVVAVGSVLPHPYAGFGGGAKIILPGVAGIETLEANHRPAVTGVTGGLNNVETNTARAEMESTAIRAGLDLIVNVVTDDRRRVVGLFCGHPIAAHRAAVARAREVYATPAPSRPGDVVVINAYPKDTEMLQVGNAFNVLRGDPARSVRPGGVVVVTAACSMGRGFHSLHGPGMRLYRTPVERSYLDGRPVVVHTPLLSEADVRVSFWTGYASEPTWDGVLGRLRAHVGDRAHVVVFPTASEQLLEAS